MSSSDVVADPLERIFALGERATRIGIAFGLVGAVALHTAAGVRAARTLFEINEYAIAVHEHVRATLRLEYNIELDEPPPPPPPEPEPPPPEPEPPPKAQPAAPPPPEEAPPPPPEPPPPAEAANLLTDPNEPLDLTGEGFVTGNAERFAGGITSSSGTSKVAIRDTRAAPGATGKPTSAAYKPAPAAPAVDRSKRAKPLRMQWNCPFPKDADADGIDSARVPVSVTVGPDGRPISATVVKDPGSGFGRSAQRCALAERYEPGLDASGKPITQTQVFFINFDR